MVLAKYQKKEVMPMYEQTEVYGLYADSWQGDLVPDAFAHP
jgi:hypothetical protein